jgi:tRNA pseudouridine65 synthase
VTKRYLALVRGNPPAEGTIDHAVRKGERGDERVAAVTHFVRLGVSPHARCALVEVVPETGRLHQIRRHFKHISHHLVGDVRYGKGDVNRAFRGEWNLHRLALHAWRVDLQHPVTGAPLTIVAPIPDDLGMVLAALGLAGALPALTG